MNWRILYILYVISFNSNVYLNNLKFTESGYQFCMYICKLGDFNYSNVMTPKELCVNILMMVNLWQAINFRFQILDMEQT